MGTGGLTVDVVTVTTVENLLVCLPDGNTCRGRTYSFLYRMFKRTSGTGTYIGSSPSMLCPTSHSEFGLTPSAAPSQFALHVFPVRHYLQEGCRGHRHPFCVKKGQTVLTLEEGMPVKVRMQELSSR